MEKGYLYEAIMASSHMWKDQLVVVLFYLSLLMLLMGPLVMIYFLVLSTLLVGTMPTGYVTAILVISILHRFAIFRSKCNQNWSICSLDRAFEFTTIILIPLLFLQLDKIVERNNNKSVA